MNVVNCFTFLYFFGHGSKLILFLYFMSTQRKESSPVGLKISLPVQIFTEDLTEVETLPRDKVLNFLKEGFKELAIPYLEHIIYVWDDKGPEFHNVLIQLYLERVQGLMKQYLNSLPEGTSNRILELI